MDEKFAEDFYGMKQEQQSASGDGFLQGGSGNPGEMVTGEEQREAHAGGIYRENNEGDVPSTYEPVLCSFFDGKEYRARFEKDDPQVDTLRAARAGANEVLRSFEVGETGAREIFNLFNDYMENPRSEEAMTSQLSQTEHALKKEWGYDYEKMTGAAKRVLQETAKRIPNLIETVDRTGIGNNIDFVRRLAYIGKRRGFAK